MEKFMDVFLPPPQYPVFCTENVIFCTENHTFNAENKIRCQHDHAKRYLVKRVRGANHDLSDVGRVPFLSAFASIT